MFNTFKKATFKKMEPLTKRINDIKKKNNDFEENLDPKTGLLLYKIFKSSTFVLILLVMPFICLLIGSLYVGGSLDDISQTSLILSGFLPWIILVFTSTSLWYYFSKWTEAEDN